MEHIATYSHYFTYPVEPKHVCKYEETLVIDYEQRLKRLSYQSGTMVYLEQSDNFGQRISRWQI